MSSEKIIKRASTTPPVLRGAITKRQIVDARAEALTILSDAEKEAAAKRESAEIFARETREAAYREGYDAALEEWSALLLEAREKRDNALSSVERDVLRLAVKIAEKIIGHELKRDKGTIAGIVANALRNAKRNEVITVRVNPAELTLIESHREKLDPSNRLQFLDIVADPRVAGGGCIIESDSGAVDAQIETQLRVLERALLTRNDTKV
jgi:type III secretion system HrpE/YscL family protein